MEKADYLVFGNCRVRLTNENRILNDAQIKNLNKLVVKFMINSNIKPIKEDEMAEIV